MYLTLHFRPINGSKSKPFSLSCPYTKEDIPIAKSLLGGVASYTGGNSEIDQLEITKVKPETGPCSLYFGNLDLLINDIGQVRFKM